jgi:transcription elongation factor Elf1
MKKFSTKVDLRSRKEMVDFLTNHYRYDTMNGWNCSTSYAHNVKIHKLGLTSSQIDKAYELLDIEETYDEINCLLNEFAEDHNYVWQVGFNGRSGGYLVLYQGERKALDYKSRCTHCGQLNYKTVEETKGSARCGRCGAEARVNLTSPIMQSVTYPGRSTDMGEDFEDWDMYSLKQRVKLVQDFDELCDRCLETFVYLIDNAQIEEEEYEVVEIHTRKTLVI